MHPRVKAKDVAVNCKQRVSCLNSNYPHFRASEFKQEEDLHIVVAKIPKIYIPSVLMSESESKETKKHIRGAEIESKQTPKPLRFYAHALLYQVLGFRFTSITSHNDLDFKFSSLDNDALIGSINKSEERKAKKGLRSNVHISNRASQRKNIDTNVKISHGTVAKSGDRLKDHI
ncbi:hypothetical protein N665_0030s0023 [Sinapis alba]|nr:hypothetical protein N665_0030s0023 [Sinapis alba]